MTVYISLKGYLLLLASHIKIHSSLLQLIIAKYLSSEVYLQVQSDKKSKGSKPTEKKNPVLVQVPQNQRMFDILTSDGVVRAAVGSNPSSDQIMQMRGLVS